MPDYLIISTPAVPRQIRLLQRRVVLWTWGIGLTLAAAMLIANAVWGWRP